MKITNQWNLFLKSFTLKPVFFFIIAYDLIFYAIITPCILIYKNIQLKKAAALRIANLETYVATASPAEMQALIQSMKSFIYFTIIGAILLLLIALFSYSFSRTLIWNYLLKKKFNTKKFLKFNLLNLFLGLFTLFLLSILLVFIRISLPIFITLFYFILVAIFLFIFLLYMNYINIGKIFKSLALTVEKFNKKIGIAYLFSIAVFAVILLLMFLLNLIIRTPYASTVTSLALLIIFTAWMRLYILSAVKE